MQVAKITCKECKATFILYEELKQHWQEKHPKDLHKIQAKLKAEHEDWLWLANATKE